MGGEGGRGGRGRVGCEQPTFRADFRSVLEGELIGRPILHAKDSLVSCHKIVLTEQHKLSSIVESQREVLDSSLIAKH